MPGPREPQSGELLMEFHIEREHRFYRVELRDHGEYGVQAQFLDPNRADRETETRDALTFRQRVVPRLPPKGTS